MSFKERDGLRYFQFETLRDLGVVQAIFTRRGGVSPAPWNTLNLGGTVGDEVACVVENRRRCFAAVDRKVESLFDVWQVHSANVICTVSPRPLQSAHQKADAILTDRPEITLFMRFADCVPIFLFDPKRRAVGLVHAGWVGTVNQIARAAVNAMRARYGSHPEDIYAGIGPSICASHYPVGEDVAEQVRQVFGADVAQILWQGKSQSHLDLWEANRLILVSAGIRKIEVSEVCTAEHPEDWYSHRGEQGKTGRFGAIIALGNGSK
ncbi:MAG TPA: peptidoglycan editing factor PgeF [Anaerolineaceae bacterium]|nr:peptidoglycan editing factor PgeF [Anaerolineaceae bacterium]